MPLARSAFLSVVVAALALSGCQKAHQSASDQPVVDPTSTVEATSPETSSPSPSPTSSPEPEPPSPAALATKSAVLITNACQLLKPADVQGLSPGAHLETDSTRGNGSTCGYRNEADQSADIQLGVGIFPHSLVDKQFSDFVASEKQLNAGHPVQTGSVVGLGGSSFYVIADGGAGGAQGLLIWKRQDAIFTLALGGFAGRAAEAQAQLVSLGKRLDARA